jgi:hypothetical protein
VFIFEPICILIIYLLLHGSSLAQTSTSLHRLLIWVCPIMRYKLYHKQVTILISYHCLFGVAYVLTNPCLVPGLIGVVHVLFPQNWCWSSINMCFSYRCFKKPTSYVSPAKSSLRNISINPHLPKGHLCMISSFVAGQTPIVCWLYPHFNWILNQHPMIAGPCWWSLSPSRLFLIPETRRLGGLGWPTNGAREPSIHGHQGRSFLMGKHDEKT